MPVTELQHVPLRKLRPNPGPRRHSRKQIGQIADSVRQFGFTSLIIALRARGKAK